ncbi:hypothetical protein NITGR_660003 [Nitrospina gracilis 3/211]|uniref:Uncharacterized protein n=1 Tax=Nitrospina gracilis (strain 3/211) TaxID=1266370 RepID=M1Z1L7_NITG3|nr:MULTISPECIES: hypothetical protein [Nitrospina]MCF8724262.1 hypothetical protein [Nitrospina sp. Nb-3]CCQ91410.1 hypothetical protein NITGR_660003 [Nitrospina gracilis 3/211]
MLVFKKNIYFHPLDALPNGEVRPYGRDEEAQPIAFNLIHKALIAGREVIEELTGYEESTGFEKLRVLFPHATRFGRLPVMDPLSKTLLDGLLNTRTWFLMNCYHLCYLYDALQEIVEDYSYSDPKRRQEMIPELGGEPINFNHFLNQFFFNTAFLISAKRYNGMTPQERRQLGKLDHAYFGAVVPKDDPEQPEDPTMGMVINAQPPGPEDISLTPHPGNPYASGALSL